MESAQRRSMSEDNVKLQSSKFSFSDLGAIPENFPIHHHHHENSFSLDDELASDDSSHHVLSFPSKSSAKQSGSSWSPTNTVSTAPSLSDDLYDDLLSTRVRSISSLEPHYLPHHPIRQHSESYSGSSSTPQRSMSAKSVAGRSRCSSEDSLELVIHYDRCKSLNLIDHSKWKHSRWGEEFNDVQLNADDIDLDIFGSGANLFPITAWISQAFSSASSLLRAPECPRRKISSACRRRRTR